MLGTFIREHPIGMTLFAIATGVTGNWVYDRVKEQTPPTQERTTTTKADPTALAPRRAPEKASEPSRPIQQPKTRPAEPSSRPRSTEMGIAGITNQMTVAQVRSVLEPLGYSLVVPPLPIPGTFNMKFRDGTVDSLVEATFMFNGDGETLNTLVFRTEGPQFLRQHQAWEARLEGNGGPIETTRYGGSRYGKIFCASPEIKIALYRQREHAELWFTSRPGENPCSSVSRFAITSYSLGSATASAAGPAAGASLAQPDSRKHRDETRVESSYVVQVAALASPDDGRVSRLVEQIATAGENAYTEVVTTASGNVIRVRAGPYRSREAAEAGRSKLKKVGLDGKVVPK